MIASTVLYLRQIALCQVAAAAALVYDYVLILGSEVDVIWARKWNLGTLLYAIVRYLSFFLTLNNVLYLTNKVWSSNSGCRGKDISHIARKGSDDRTSYFFGSRCLALYQVRQWGPYIFRVAVDVIMIKRVYALSQQPRGFLNSPKWVLGIMLTVFIAKNVTSIILLLLAIGPGSPLVSIDAVISGIHVCGIEMSREMVFMSAQLPTLAFEILLFVLAFSYLVADIWELWRSRATSNRKVGDLVQILVRDSTIYFAINVLATALNFGNYSASRGSQPTVYIAVSLALQSFLPFCFAPRLVINMREYENRVHSSKFGEELNDMVTNEGHFPQDTDQMVGLA